MVQIEELLSRLQKVKKTGPGKWQAVCPAHEDRSPSLAIKDADGTILCHCFAGCQVEDVLGAIGLEMIDLFPDTGKKEWQGETPIKFTGGLKFNAMDALRALAGEGSVVLLLACDQAEGRVLSQVDRDRLMTAVGRINAALGYLGDQDDIERALAPI
jgi:hypothetical protein